MNPWGTKKIEPADEENWEHDTEMEPTIKMTKKEARQFYHGMYATSYFVELPDGSYGQLKIEPSEWDRTIRGRVYKRYGRFRRRLSEKLGKLLSPLVQRIDERLDALDET